MFQRKNKLGVNAEQEGANCICKIESVFLKCKSEWDEQQKCKHKRDIQVTGNMSHCSATNFARRATEAKTTLCT